jgi:hypothetical protein
MGHDLALVCALMEAVRNMQTAQDSLQGSVRELLTMKDHSDIDVIHGPISH